jgi:signal transduction histidine kinase
MDSTILSNDAARVSELRSYGVLDTPPEEVFDEFTKLAAHICQAPISLVSLVDTKRVWFKSKFGLAASEIPRIEGFCSNAIWQEKLLIVPDATANERLASHPLVTSPPKLRFYAGAPLTTPRGHRIGTLCVIDTIPRDLNEEQAEALKSLARTVITQLELRRVVKNSADTLSGKLIKAQDDERRRIARELHDSTGQLLVALGLTLSQMQRESPTANVDRFEECRELLRAATGEIRNLSYLLHPPLIDELGLASALLDYAQGFAKRSALKIEVDIAQEVGRLDATLEIALFRIVQEALGNIHRHSGSPVANIKMFSSGNQIVLEIADKGRGLSFSARETAKFGVGLKSMQERLRPFGGSLQINSNAGGTELRAVVPRGTSFFGRLHSSNSRNDGKPQRS